MSKIFNEPDTKKIDICNHFYAKDQTFAGEYCSTPGAFLIDIERILALLPMDELILPKPDFNKLMAVMPNFEDFEDLIIRRLECGGRGTVSGGGYDTDI